MIKRTVLITTRPFQPFFLGADDLLKLAKPYFEKIQEYKNNYEQTGVVIPVPKDIWQIEKSLSIGSFFLKYSGLEGLVNCMFDDFKCNDIDSLPEEYFVGPLLKKRKQLITRSFPNWTLTTRVFLIIPICSEPAIDPRKEFDTDSTVWKEFKEIILIRNWLIHAASDNIRLELTKTGPKFWTANDQHPDNFWPINKVSKDHRIFNYELACKLNETIDWIVTKLRSSLPDQINDSYMTQEHLNFPE